MTEKLVKTLKDYMSPSQAAALAVISSNIRRSAQENIAKSGGPESEEEKELIQFLQHVEDVALGSIQKNDGEVIYWLGVASRQMNPLLD